MSPFPQLIEEDFDKINLALNELLAKSEASTALFVEKAGYLISECGAKPAFDTTELATLAANAFAATQFIADRLEERNFTSMFQQGEATNVLWINVDDNSLIVIIFHAYLSAGAIKYYALNTAKHVAAQLQIATERAPDGGFDLATLDPTDVSDVFKSRRPLTETPPDSPSDLPPPLPLD